MLAFSANFAQAQKVDLAFGISTVDAPGASAASGNHLPVSLNGGAYPGFSGDVLFLHNFGIGAEIYWKGTQGNYAGDPTLPYRPIFFDFNAVYAPKIASHVYAELVGGIGAQDTRLYCQGCGNGYNTNYSSDKHFLGDFGGGLKLYPKGRLLRSSRGTRLLREQQQLFSSARATRYGVSIGYTFGKH